MTKIGCDYTFPIFYQDLPIIHTLYFKRFYATVFTDFGQGYNLENEQTDKYQSAGFEFISNTFLVPYDMNMKFGFRYSRLTNLNSNMYEIIITL